jgi:hypothetical protein
VPQKARDGIAASDFNDWNQRVVADFRANEGRVGGSFEGAQGVVVIVGKSA